LFEKLKSGLEDFLDKISKTELNEKTIESLIEELRLILLQNDVAYSVAERICDQLREQLNALEVKRFGDHMTEAKTILQDILLKRKCTYLISLKENKRKKSPL
jgi:signal recognition particle GTPase